MKQRKKEINIIYTYFPDYSLLKAVHLKLYELPATSNIVQMTDGMSFSKCQ